MRTFGHLLIVDDDQDVQGVLSDALSPRYIVSVVSDGRTALHEFVTKRPELILLDLRMPDMDGVVLITMIRKVSAAVAIIVLSARHEQADVVTCLRSGADDFIAKPFDFDDLEARIEAVLRRARRDRKDPQAVWKYGNLTISDARGLAIDGQPVHLTPLEYRMMRALAQHPEATVTRDQLARDVWGYEDDGTLKHILDVHMGRLRRRLSQLHDAPHIVTMPREGFMLQMAAEVDPTWPRST